jgi:hydrogenase expression/formation protein HypC
MCLAIPGKIVELVSGKTEAGIVEVAGVRRKVQLGLLAEDMPKAGDWVLIHVGFAMSKISESDAAEQMRLLSMLGETEQAMQEVRGYGLEEVGKLESSAAETFARAHEWGPARNPQQGG